MMIGYAAFWVLFVSVVAAAILIWRHPLLAKRRSFLLIFVGIGAAVAVVEMISGFVDLRRELSMTRWPIVEGAIVTSEVGGERAFHPEITYSYEVNGIDYSGSSALNAPGFGGKRNRLEQAEILARQYSAGSPISVHYDPSDPAISVLKAEVTYNTYLQLALGLFLIIGVLIWFVFLIRKP